MWNLSQKHVPTMIFEKISWRNLSNQDKGSVIRTRLIFQAVFPAVKKHAIQRGSVRTICSCKWPNRTATGGAEPIMLSIPTCAPPRQVCDSYLLINSNTDRCSCICLRQAKSRPISYAMPISLAMLASGGNDHFGPGEKRQF